MFKGAPYSEKERLVESPPHNLRNVAKKKEVANGLLRFFVYYVCAAGGAELLEFQAILEDLLVFS